MSLFVISAPSGCGKSTVIREIRKMHPEYIFSVSVTTRTPRPDETDGVHYHFLTESAFHQAQKDSLLLEHVFLEPFYYGTPLSELDKHHGGVMLLDLDVHGALAVRERFPDAVIIMLVPPSIEELERRLRGRRDGMDEAELQSRLQRAEGELSEKTLALYSHIIVNDDIKQTVAAVEKIILHAAEASSC